MAKRGRKQCRKELTKGSTTAVGNAFEDQVYEFLSRELAAGRLWLNKECCSVVRKKSYYSRDRQTEIIFDVAIEAYLPKSRDLAFLMLFECKSLGRPVEVGDVEEFWAKAQQVSGLNVKPVVVRKNSFGLGARMVARSKKMGLIRWFDVSGFKWELPRSSSVTSSGDRR
jgi:hypothetical protein